MSRFVKFASAVALLAALAPFAAQAHSSSQTGQNAAAAWASNAPTDSTGG
ncbi:MAG TPA: hypothetical protein VMH92_02315 [Acidocella sp.]|nr:hypothetical protein [Acidocella sp.]